MSWRNPAAPYEPVKVPAYFTRTHTPVGGTWNAGVVGTGVAVIVVLMAVGVAVGIIVVCKGVPATVTTGDVALTLVPVPPFISTKAPMTTAITIMTMRAAAINRGFPGGGLVTGNDGTEIAGAGNDDVTDPSGTLVPVAEEITGSVVLSSSGFATRIFENIRRFF